MEMEDERGEWGKAKKSLDRKLGDLRDDLEDKEHAVTQLKRKAAKFQEELQDTNLVLNQQVARFGNFWIFLVLCIFTNVILVKEIMLRYDKNTL